MRSPPHTDASARVGSVSPSFPLQDSNSVLTPPSPTASANDSIPNNGSRGGSGARRQSATSSSSTSVFLTELMSHKVRRRASQAQAEARQMTNPARLHRIDRVMLADAESDRRHAITVQEQDAYGHYLLPYHSLMLDYLRKEKEDRSAAAMSNTSITNSMHNNSSRATPLQRARTPAAAGSDARPPQRFISCRATSGSPSLSSSPSLPFFLQSGGGGGGGAAGDTEGTTRAEPVGRYSGVYLTSQVDGVGSIFPRFAVVGENGGADGGRGGPSGWTSPAHSAAPPSSTAASNEAERHSCEAHLVGNDTAWERRGPAEEEGGQPPPLAAAAKHPYPSRRPSPARLLFCSPASQGGGRPSSPVANSSSSSPPPPNEEKGSSPRAARTFVALPPSSLQRLVPRASSFLQAQEVVRRAELASTEAFAASQLRKTKALLQTRGEV